jgi:hypothetical protein
MILLKFEISDSNGLHKGRVWDGLLNALGGSIWALVLWFKPLRLEMMITSGM